MRRTKSFLALPLLSLALLSSPARADKKIALEGQPPIRHKLELRKLRFEVTPQFVVSMNQDFRTFVGAGLVLQFHITDWLGIGASVSVMFNSNTPLEDKVRGQLAGRDESKGFVYQYPGPQPSLQMHDERILNINFLGSLYASRVIRALGLGPALIWTAIGAAALGILTPLAQGPLLLATLMVFMTAPPE